jgi:hypothetical protein
MLWRSVLVSIRRVAKAHVEHLFQFHFYLFLSFSVVYKPGALSNVYFLMYVEYMRNNHDNEKFVWRF